MRILGSVVSCLASGALASGCASTQGKFEKIAPQMSADEVTKAMGSGPTRFEAVAESEYASWYWGNDYCVLFRNGKVVAKDASEKGRTASFAGGKYEEKRQASCLAPGSIAGDGRERTLNIPGLGTLHLPRARDAG